MLKRKLEKAALVALSFFFMAATPGKQPRKDRNPVSCKECLTGQLSHVFDSTGLCVCLPELDEENRSLAPRIQLNRQAADFVNLYLKKEGFYLQKIKARSGSYFKVMDEVFSRYELPLELKYLAVVESRLNPATYSKAGAAGIWQFMPAPARTFGLKVSGGIDERKHTYKSTVAAAKCLSYLYKMFDDWLLTIAAYNCGPGGVLKAIKRSGSRDYWVLQHYLPAETRKHVKKYISMHYFFEGHGGITTLTKTETDTHIRAVTSFMARQAKDTDSSLQQTAIAEELN